MKKIKASSLDPRRESLLMPFLALLLIPMLALRAIVALIRVITSPFINWNDDDETVV